MFSTGRLTTGYLTVTAAAALRLGFSCLFFCDRDTLSRECSVGGSKLGAGLLHRTKFVPLLRTDPFRAPLGYFLDPSFQQQFLQTRSQIIAQAEIGKGRQSVRYGRIVAF